MAHQVSLCWWRSWEPIRTRAVERAVVITRVSVRDFDHGDQVHALHWNCRQCSQCAPAGRVAG